MLEDFTMEKKPSNRSVQIPGKGCATEPKKTQDVINGKQLPRSRRREQPNCSNNGKFDQGRRPNPQKSKSLDKRPRPRGQYHYGGKEDTQVGELYESELVPVTFSGSKKQNLNHLLNFHYEPRGENVSRPFCQRSYQYGSRLRLSTHKHKYNKEHFLQANCQFVVRADGDYSPYMADPDTLVGWDFVEQIRVASVESGTCPICLSTPVAGKMTRCGHVYCYPCILHYLALSDKTWRKCPICYEAVHKNDLKSVMVLNRVAYTVGQKITFQLMKRERGSLIASPVSQFDLRQSYTSPLLSVSEKLLDTAYSKLLVANNSEILQIIEKEKYELEQQLIEEQGCPEQCFIEQALELVSQRKQALVGKKEVAVTCQECEYSGPYNVTPPSFEVPSEPICTEKIVYQSAFDDISSTSHDGKETESLTDLSVEDKHTEKLQESDISENAADLSRPRYESVSSDGDDSNLITTITAEDLEISSHPQTPAKNFFFYQAIDGQQIYLHAVNVRMLELNYGSLERSPHTVTGIIVEKESGSMTEDLRKRLRYLQHLPLTCQFEVAEIQLVPPVVSQETLDTFKEQLELRRRRRQKRARDERRREKKIQEVECKMFGRHPSPRIRIESFHHFPHCGIMTPDTFPRPTSPESSRASSPSSVSHCSESSITRTLSALVLDQSVQPTTCDASGPSFAEMLREGKTNRIGRNWPTGCAQGGVGVKNTVLASSSPLSHNSVDSDTEAPAPRFHQSFSDAITVALEQASIHKDDADASSGKKKKKRQKILFSTGMTCISK